MSVFPDNTPAQSGTDDTFANSNEGKKWECKKSGAFGPGAVPVLTATNAPRPSTTVDNVNLTERMHNGSTGYRNA
jgi:hypothetical protein